MDTQELPSALPEISHISVDRLKLLKPSNAAYLSLALCGKLFAKGKGVLKTADQDRQEAEYLKQKLIEGRPKNLNLNDSDKLWLATQILFLPEQARLAYEIIRAAEITALGGRIPIGWNSSRIHQELNQHPQLLQRLNRRQILLGDSASLNLLNQELQIYEREKKKGLSTGKKLTLAGGAALISTASVLGGYQPPKPAPPETSEVSTSTPQPRPPKEFIPALQLTAVPPATEIPKPTLTVTSEPSPTTKPTQTATVSPTPKPTEKIPTPEIKIEKEDLLRGVIAPRIYKEVVEKREQRAREDPDFLSRVDLERAENRINGLLLGVDGGDRLTDSIMVFSYHMPSNSLTLISIPRDLMDPLVLKKTGSAANSRINQAFAVGGIELARKALENAVNLPLDLAMVIRFDLLEDLINQTVGTIEVDIEKPFNDPTVTSMTKGVHTVDGTRAVAIARSRLGSSGGDYDRIDRQQLIVNGLIKKLQERGQNAFEAIKIYDSIRNLLNHKVSEGAVETDFEIDTILPPIFSQQSFQLLPQLLWNKITQGQWKVGEMPAINRLVISNQNLVVGAGIPGVSITKIAGGDPHSSDIRGKYYARVRQAVGEALDQAAKHAPADELQVILPKLERVLYPEELPYNEVEEWIGKLRDSHDSVLTESIFTKELAGLLTDKRNKVLEAIASAHTEALIEHYGDTEAIIGLDPGHGGSDPGSSGVKPEGGTLLEKDLTWKLTQMIAEKVYQQTQGKYIAVVLRPENPNDLDLDKDGILSPIERLQKRKALLLKMEEKLRPDPTQRGYNILYLSVHLNGSPDPSQSGAETYWPNRAAVNSDRHREASQKLAHKLHEKIIEAIRQNGYPVIDRGAKQDPDERQPLGNSETTVGPYIALGSSKLDRNLDRIK